VDPMENPRERPLEQVGEGAKVTTE
jgi:hypothetical protein